MENENQIGDVNFEDIEITEEDLKDGEQEVTEESQPAEPVKEEEPKEEPKEVEEETQKEQPIPEFDFEINYNGTKEKLNKEDAIQLAQKGKDYDRIRPVYDFVKELAEDEGKSIEDYIKVTTDNLKDYKIKQLAEEKGINEDVAKELYEATMQSKALKKKSLASEEELHKRDEAESKKDAEFQDFLKQYPDIKASEIPQKVWDEVARNNIPLKYAYMQYEMEQIKNENSILKTNAKNKEQEITTGTQAESTPKDVYEDAWDNA